MELNYSRQNTPTFPQWVKNVENPNETQFNVDRVFANSEWKTLTFCTSEFRVNFKYLKKEEYAKVIKQVKSTLSKPCRAYITVNYEEQACKLSLTIASDADEDAAIFEPDDFGYVLTNPAKP